MRRALSARRRGQDVNDGWGGASGILTKHLNKNGVDGGSEENDATIWTVKEATEMNTFSLSLL